MVKIVVKLVHFKQAMVSQSADKIIINLVLFLFSSRGCYMPTIFILCSRIWTFIMKPTVAMERRSLGLQRQERQEACCSLYQYQYMLQSAA